MITKIYFPIINTDSLKYESDINLTVEEYEHMVNDHYARNRGRMNDFYQNGFSVRDNNYFGVDKNTNRVDYNNISDCVEYSEAEACVNDYNKSELNVDFIENLINNERMCILEMNINPNSLDFDVASEIKLWIGDSNNINQSTSLDNNQKLTTLQGRDINMDVHGYNRVKLNNCKILQDNSTQRAPMNVIIIVEKITLV
jgi:hypothetical protein